MNKLTKWLEANAEGIVDLLETLDNTEMKEWNPGFAAAHTKWKRDRQEIRNMKRNTERWA